MPKTDNPFGPGYQEYKPGEFFKFDEVGKKIQGTLVDVKYNQPNELNPDKPQTVYTIRMENGNEMRVSKPSIDDAMKKVAIGQTVGLWYSEDVPSKKKGNKPFKLVRVYPGQMDPKFISNKQVDALAEAFGGEEIG